MKAKWQYKKINEIAQHSLGKMLDKVKNKGEPKPYLRNLNVRWFDFDLSDVLEMRFLPEEATRYTAIKGDVLRNYSDTTKARKVLGWQAQTALPDGLNKTLAWFLSNPS